MRRDGSEKGDEWLHYACGMPFKDHDQVSRKGKLVMVCPDEKRNAFNQRDRPTGRAANDDPEDARYE